ncbi:MAG: DUF86 domain-containing protein [Bacteroidales bacterium]|nr:DUF86 domain-containing protein [Bacteroidales bacterium]
MYPKRDRVLTLLDAAIKEIHLLIDMSKDIEKPEDFDKDLSGLVIFRACGMSLQYITESYVKIRNICGNDFFKRYKSIPWPSVFGMRNFLSHGYGEVDTEGIFNTIKGNIPELLRVSEAIRQDLTGGKLDPFFTN